MEKSRKEKVTFAPDDVADPVAEATFGISATDDVAIVEADDDDSLKKREEQETCKLGQAAMPTMQRRLQPHE